MPNPARLKAIVADDHDLFRNAIASLLKDQCDIAEVVEAASLDEAIEQLENASDFSIAIFDLAMPGMSSAASLRTIREQHPDLLCIVLTGSSDRRDIFVALDAGVHGFILKTLPAHKIAAAIRYVVSGDIYVPSEIASLAGASSLMTEAPGPAVNAVKHLSRRQREILELLSDGIKTNKEIGRALNLTENTVKVHVNAIFRIFNIHDRRSLSDIMRNGRI